MHPARQISDAARLARLLRFPPPEIPCLNPSWTNLKLVHINSVMKFARLVSGDGVDFLQAIIAMSNVGS